MVAEDVDVEAVKADLRSSVKKNRSGDSCTPYGGDDILKLIAIHLLPMTTTTA